MNNKNAIKQIETSLKELAKFKRYESEIGFSDLQALNKFKKLVERTTPKTMDELRDEIIEKLTPFYEKYYKNHNFNKKGKIVFKESGIVWRTITRDEGQTDWVIYTLYDNDFFKSSTCRQLTNEEILMCAEYFDRLEEK